MIIRGSGENLRVLSDDEALEEGIAVPRLSVERRRRIQSEIAKQKLAVRDYKPRSEEERGENNE